MIGGGVVLFVLYGAFTGLWLGVVGWFLLNAAEAERGTSRTGIEPWKILVGADRFG